MSFVLDCSVAVTWCFADEASPLSDALLNRLEERGALVPQLWHLEIGNVLLQAERCGRLTSADVTARIHLLGKLPIATDSETAIRALQDVLSLARQHGLTTYDAAYLELAARRGLPLATRDHALRRAAEHSGLDVLPT